MSATIVTATSNAADLKLNEEIAAKVEAIKAATVATPGHVTKALTGLKLAKTAKDKAIKLEDREVKAVRTANDGLRIDHSTCNHAKSGTEGKKARATCRAAVAKALATK